MSPARWSFLGVALLALAGDILTKHMVVEAFYLGETRQVFGDWVRLTYIHNPGAAFGLFAGSRFVLIAVSLVAAIVVVTVAWNRRTNLATAIPLGLILGGAVGNLIDRIRMGEVVDFVQVGIPPHSYWPVFNVADSAVTVGVVWLAAGLLFGADHADTSAEPGSPEDVNVEDTVARVAPSRDDG